MSFLLLITYNLLLTTEVAAATSPWSQTDWSGGNGQTSWSDTTKFDSSSSVTTSTASEVTLQATSSWCSNANCSSSWKYRRKITFDNTDATLGVTSEALSNFPVLVVLTSSNIDYTDTQDNGEDLRFTDTDGTDLAYEIESWNESGSSYVWVKVPAIDINSNTDYIYMYHGNTSALDHQQTTSVWSNNYAGVWHLKESGNGTAGEYVDSSGNGNHGQGGGGTASQVPTQVATGQIGKAQSFDGATNGDYITMGDKDNLMGETYTYTFWFNDPGNQDARAIISKMGSPWNTGFLLFYVDPQILKIYFASNGTSINEANVFTLNQWVQGTVVFNNGTVSLYKNGQFVTSASPGRQLSTNDFEFLIGKQTGYSTRHIKGQLDEIRASSTVHSAAWIAASYKSETNGFNTFASEEQLYSSTPGTLTSSIFDSDQGSNWGTLTYSATTPTNTSVSVKIRTSNSSSMTGATAFSSCNAVTSGSDISGNSCVTDGDRYIQYEVTLINTDSISTPTFEDISIAFSSYDTVGPTLELDSPNDNNYTNSDRPTFRFKQATDSISSVSGYELSIDNPSLVSSQPSGDFTISDIPVSRTTDYDTNKYTVRYENFNDNDSNNNYISITTKPSSDWGNSENNGMLREGKVSWRVKTTDSIGNYTEHTRTLFVDKTNPQVEIEKINDLSLKRGVFSHTSNTSQVLRSNSWDGEVAYSTTDTTPTIIGGIDDSLSGPSPSSGQVQDENGPKIASGPKSIEIKIEKKKQYSINSTNTYELFSLYTLNINSKDMEWSCDDSLITDNNKQKCDKYAEFEYTPKEQLTSGTYRITITGKDKADNTSLSQTITLNITSISKLLTKEERKTIEKIVDEEAKELTEEEKEKVIKELEITKPIESPKPNALTNTLNNTVNQTKSLLSESLSDSIELLVKNYISEYSRLTALSKEVVGSVNSVASFTGEKANQGITFAAQKADDTANTIAEGYNHIASQAPGVSKTILTGIGNGVSTVVNTVGSVSTLTATAIGSTAEKAGNTTTTVLHNTKDSIANTAFTIGEKTQDMSERGGYVLVRFGYLFVNEPTTISDVNVIVLSPTEAKVSWKTNHPATGKVNWGYNSGDYSFEQQTTKRTTEHEFLLTNLTPDTEYHYEVMSQNKNYVYDANRSFRTIP